MQLRYEDRQVTIPAAYVDRAGNVLCVACADPDRVEVWRLEPDDDPDCDRCHRKARAVGALECDAVVAVEYVTCKIF